MWCESKKNGTVVYRERYMDPLTDKSKVVSVAKPKDTPQNRNKAQRELSAKIEKLIQSVQCTQSDITLKTLQDAYIKAQTITEKQSTVTRNNIVTMSVINILGPDAIVDNLTAQYVNTKLLNSNKKISTLNTYITRFKAMLNWGYANDYHDNIKLISKLKQYADSSSSNEDNIREKYLEPEEIKKLIDYIKSSKQWHWYYTTYILLFTGMRFGELAALEKSDIDLKKNEISITKTYDSINDVVTTPKTDNSIRTIHIQPDLKVLLNQCMLWRNELMLMNNIRTNIFIPNIKNGYYMQHRAFEKYISTISAKLLNHRITPHMLRHTHASLLAANGMTPDEIARRLGHSKSIVTSNIYIHTTQKVVMNDNKKLDKIELFS